MARRTKDLKPGAAFEKEVAGVCSAYLTAGLAKIEKVDPPSRTIVSHGITRTILLPSPFLDFIGTLMPSGRAVMMECKLTSEPRLEIRNNDEGNGVKRSQLLNARAWMDTGACVCFLWRFGEHTRILTPEMIEAENLTRKSIRWEQAFRLFSTDLVPFDFLAAVRALYGIN